MWLLPWLQDKNNQHIMYRIHDLPPRDKLENLNSALEQFNIKVPMDGGIRPSFSNLLDGSKNPNIHNLYRTWY